MIQDFGVTAIHCTPSYAMHLAEVAEEMNALQLDTLKTGSLALNRGLTR